MADDNFPPGDSVDQIGEGTLGKLIREKNWAATALGPFERWPTSLKNYVSMIVRSPTPAIIFWGDQHLQVYNDKYAMTLGSRPLEYLGEPYRNSSPDMYSIIYPWMKRVLENGEIVNVDRIPVTVTRHGFNEETFFTFTFSPLLDDHGKVEGLLQIVNEVFETEIVQRRLQLIRRLGSDHNSRKKLCEHAINILSADPSDVPFMISFLINSGGYLEFKKPLGTKNVDLSGPFSKRLKEIVQSVISTNAYQLIEDIQSIVPHDPIVPGYEKTRTAIALPIKRFEKEMLHGVIILGISPRLVFNKLYLEFCEAIAQEIATALALVEERKAHQKSEAARDSLVRLFMQAPIAICVYSGPEHVYEFANNMYYSIINQKNNIIGKSIKEVFPELVKQGYVAILDNVYTSGTPFIGRDAPLNITSEDGKVSAQYVDFFLHPRRNHRGHIDGIVAVANDVTDRKKAEEALKIAVEEARLSSQFKTHFLANMSHEIRTPLGLIQGFAELALDPTNVELERINHLLTIKRNAENLTKLIGKILDLTKIEAGKIEIEKINFPLRPVLEEIISLLNFRARDKGLILSLKFHGDVPININTDMTRLRQILLNLIGNAIKFTETGSVEVEVTSCQKSLKETEFKFAVTDTGVGISDQYQSKLFQPFSQADSSMNRKYGGTGLGLNLSKHLAQALGGDLSLHLSKLGVGSIFELTVISENLDEKSDRSISDEQKGKESLESNLEYSLNDLKILVVEDSLDNQMLISWYLRQAGAVVDLANNGEEGITKATKNDYDIIIMDIQMPKMDGYEATKKLRELGIHTPIIALTAHALTEEKEKALNVGCDDYLTKPFNRDALIQTIAHRLTH